MGRPSIQSFQLTDNINVYECHPDSERQYRHWRVWDERERFNVVMSAKTKEEALVQAIDHFAERFFKERKELVELQKKVDAFVDAVRPPEESGDD